MTLQSVLIYLFIFKSEAIPPHCKMKPKVSKDDILTPTSTSQTVHLQCGGTEEKTEGRTGGRTSSSSNVKVPIGNGQREESHLEKPLGWEASIVRKGRKTSWIDW